MTSRIFEIVKPHIESSLANGYEKLDIANLLAKSEKYTGAITNYVGAYEEIGQSLFLVEAISNNEKMSEESIKDLFKPGTHNQKILDSYITRRDRLKKHPPKDFEKVKNSKIGQDFRNPYNLDETTKKINERIKILSKLHNLRQVFDYSHSKEGQISGNDYDDDELDSFCYYLKSECLLSYYETKLNLEGQYLKSQGYTNDELLLKIPSLPSYEEFQELSKEFNSKINKKRRINGLKFLESF